MIIVKYPCDIYVQGLTDDVIIRYLVTPDGLLRLVEKYKKEKKK